MPPLGSPGGDGCVSLSRHAANFSGVRGAGPLEGRTEIGAGSGVEARGAATGALASGAGTAIAGADAGSASAWSSAIIGAEGGARRRWLRIGLDRGRRGRGELDLGLAPERDDHDRSPCLCRDHPAEATDDQRRRLGAIDARGADHAQPGPAIEIDDVDPPGVRADAHDQIAARVPARVRDRLGQLVRLGLAAVDERDHVDPRRLLLGRHPHRRDRCPRPR